MRIIGVVPGAKLTQKFLKWVNSHLFILIV